MRTPFEHASGMVEILVAAMVELPLGRAAQWL
jgi:hypothetical protein